MKSYYLEEIRDSECEIYRIDIGVWESDPKYKVT